jgi:PTS system cellobiose-specific IIC component
VLQGILIIIGVAVYLPFLHAYERAIMSKNTRKIIEDIEQKPSDTTEINNTSDGHVLDGKTIILMCNEGMSTSMVAKNAPVCSKYQLHGQYQRNKHRQS